MYCFDDMQHIKKRRLLDNRACPGFSNNVPGLDVRVINSHAVIPLILVDMPFIR